MKTFKNLSLITISLLFLMIAIQCEKQPSSPVYDNPLDPQNPGTGGDPFELSAEISGGGITLTWNPVININSETYRIFRKLDLEDFELCFETDSLAQTSWVDTNISNGYRYIYYISVFDDSGEQINSYNTEIEIHAEPIFSIDDDDGFTSQINVYLTILTVGAEKMQIAFSDTALIASPWVDYQTKVSLVLTLGEGAKTVFGRFAYTNGDTSEIVSDTTCPAPMNPSIIIDNDLLYTAAREVQLSLSAGGAAWIRISNDTLPDSLGTPEQWIPYAETIDWELSSGEGSKTVWVEFRSEFEITEAASDSILPLPISAECNINHGAEFTASRQVWIFPQGAGENLQMMFSEDQSFSGVSWEDWADSTEFVLSTGAGIKTVYGRFINDFAIVEDCEASISPLAMNPSVIIDNDLLYTAAREVQLSLSAGGAAWIRISNDTLPDSLGTPEQWIPYAETIDWELSSGEGSKTVWVEFRSEFEITEAASDSILPLPISAECNINHGAEFTASRQVWIFPQGAGENLLMMFSEDSTFANANWQELCDSLAFPLSSANDLKTVYGVFINDFQIESDLLQANISPSPVTADFYTANDSIYVNNNAVNVIIDSFGALEMKIGETSDSSTIDWQSIQNQTTILLSDGDGIKRISGWFKNDFIISAALVDSLFLDTYANIDTFYWFSDGEDTLNAGDVIEFYVQAENDMIGVESGGEVTVTFPDDQKSIDLNDDGAGYYSAIYTIQSGDCCEDGYFAAQLFDRAGNLSPVFQASEPVCILTYWERTYDNLNSDDKGYSLIPCSDGGYVVTGTTESADKDVILLKTDGNGNQQWLRTYDYGIDEGFWVEQTNDGGFAVVGNCNSGSGLKNVLLIKTDQLGMEQWHYTYGGALNDEGNCVRQTADGGFIITGYTRSFGGGENDVWLIKTDELGVEQWNRTFGSGNIEIGNHVIIANDGGFAVAAMKGSGSFGYARLIKTDSQGNLLWEQDYLGTQSTTAYSVKQNYNQGYALTGYSTQSGIRNLFLITTDSNGNLLNSPVFGGVEESIGYDVIISANGGMQITGKYGEQLYIVETDPSGSLLEEHFYSGNGEAEGRCIRLAHDGAFITAGSCLSTSGTEKDIFLIKSLP